MQHNFHGNVVQAQILVEYLKETVIMMVTVSVISYVAQTIAKVPFHLALIVATIHIQVSSSCILKSFKYKNCNKTVSFSNVYLMSHHL